jgi:8-oxo-dGTP pyrophosphatase MutT (NUDIX family)
MSDETMVIDLRPEGEADLRLLAGVFVFRRTKKGKLRWLLLHRAGKDVWEFPKGRIDPHEDRLMAAQREAEEETGLAIHVLRRHGAFTVAYVSDGGTRKRLWYYLGSASDKNVQLTPEHDSCAWLHANEVIKRLRWPPTHRQFVWALHQLRNHDHVP